MESKRESVVDINIDALYEYHETILSNNMNNKRYTNTIVNVLGGIDNVLKDYITITKQINNISLNTDQIQQIYQIISNNDIMSSENENKNEKETDHESKSNVIYLDETNNFLYSLCSYKIARKIKYIWYNKYIVGLLMVASAIWYAINIAFPIVNSWIYYFISEIVFAAIICIYMLLLMLSVNKKAFYNTLKMFDFYIKVYHICVVTVALNVYWSSIKEHKHVKVMDNIQRIVMLLLVMTFSIVDGLKMSWKYLAVLGIFTSVTATSQASMYQFVYHSTHPEKTIKIYANISVSLLSYISGCYRVLTIFLWKQTIKIALSKGDSFIAMRISPKKKWTVNFNNHNMLNNRDQDQALIQPNIKSGI